MDEQTEVVEEQVIELAQALGWWGVPLAILAGAIRASTPFLFVALGECLTERSGRINLGLEGSLVMGALAGFAFGLITGNPWIGVAAAAGIGAVFGLVHGALCSLKRVNDIAVGIAIMLFGLGLAFYLGKPFIQAAGPRLPAVNLGFWSDYAAVQSALSVNALFVIGIVLAPLMLLFFRNTRWGMVVRMVGDNEEAARAAGYSPVQVRILATMVGSAMAGIGGAFLSLYYPGGWSEGLSSGQGLMAVALVIFARWHPVYCMLAALLFGAAGSIGPALQSVGVSWGYYLFNATPYVLTLAIMILACSRHRTLRGAPGELSVAR
ncbi:ABC transporter permease [Aquisalimonas asiatica]|uniref:Simple sugar transport system permease protein n=1 Tax=Aquisalimonas asiatica TaxID=406100 RepID=A0A1H8S451_9GAMM|nr:ABC transporter permease [Aquisalimonas asiatica]SEO73425.1 simple sugar transport system permease protein [Aquisalimonas asiatica]